MKTTGIDAISYYVPELYVPLSELAERRDIPFEKLRKGLGLEKMAIPDANEDAASFAANALLRLFRQNNLDPREIGRIYLGTESAVDGSKPTATYAVEVVENELREDYGERCFRNCDVVDLTFACVGAVDAMHNCIDWVQNGSDRKAIVVASDLSKYELNSTGEYTQGAGAVAVLITEDPAIISIEPHWGVATKSVGDFFKPRRAYSKKDLAKVLLKQFDANFNDAELDEWISKNSSGFWSDNNELVELFKEEPVFDGQYSNQCYSDRVTEAIEHFGVQADSDCFGQWDYLVFHLPYAYHGRRIILRNWLDWVESSGQLAKLEAEIGPKGDDLKTWTRAVSKSSMYQSFVNDSIEMSERASSEIGNMYTASIFMALLSLAAAAIDENIELTGKKTGFIAYGSGSKSKVFEGTFQDNWKERINRVDLFEGLNSRTAIDVDTYEQLHTRQLESPVKNNESISLKEIETENVNALGLRKYQSGV